MRAFVFVSAFTAFIIGCAWILFTLKEESQLNEKPEVARLVAVASGVTARYYDENNQLEKVVNSEQVREYSGNKGAFFEHVLVQGMKNGKLILKADSQKAWMAKNHQLINFFEEVNLIDDPDGENPITIKGKKVSYRVKSNQLLSDQPVLVTDNGSEQKLNNFMMNLATRVVTSNEKVTAIFTPIEKKK